MFRRSILVACAFMLVCSQAWAHEFIVRPSKSQLKPGESVSFSVLSAHVFMQSEELEDAGDVVVTAVDATGSRKIPLAADAKAFTYNGTTSFTPAGYVMLVGHRLPQVWSKTPEGMQKGGKEAFPNAPFANSYEKFCKTLLAVGKGNDAWSKPAGQALEIMPMADPSGYKVGQEAAFRIMYDGQPLSTEVYATCDGYTKTPNSYAWFTETDDKGIAQVKFGQKGLWMVRVQHKVPGKDGIKEHVMRSVLVFAVN